MWQRDVRKLLNRIEIDPDVVSRRVNQELVLVHLGRNEMFALNETGARLWELLEQKHSLEDAVARITSEYEVEEREAREEAEALLRSLADQGIVKLLD